MENKENISTDQNAQANVTLVTSNEIELEQLPETIDKFFEEKLDDERMKKAGKLVHEASANPDHLDVPPTSLEDLEAMLEIFSKDDSLDDMTFTILEGAVNFARFVKSEAGKVLTFSKDDMPIIKELLNQATTEFKNGEIDEKNLNSTVDLFLDYILFTSMSRPDAKNYEFEKLYSSIENVIKENSHEGIEYIESIM